MRMTIREYARLYYIIAHSTNICTVVSKHPIHGFRMFVGKNKIESVDQIWTKHMGTSMTPCIVVSPLKIKYWLRWLSEVETQLGPTYRCVYGVGSAHATTSWHIKIIYCIYYIQFYSYHMWGHNWGLKLKSLRQRAMGFLTVTGTHPWNRRDIQYFNAFLTM